MFVEGHGSGGEVMKDIIQGALSKNAHVKATHSLKKPFKDIKIWNIGTPVCIERSRVAFLTKSGEISIGGSLPGWADIYDIDNFRPAFEWFGPVQKEEA